MNITPKQYDEMSKQASPNSKSYINIPGAFLFGGLICTIGQVCMNIFKNAGLEK